MNPAQLHLLVNHAPLYFVFFGALFLVGAILRDSHEIRMAALGLLLAAGVLGVAAAWTGDEAEDAVETLPGVTKALIHEHEEAADFARGALVLVGAGALALGVAEARRARAKAAQAKAKPKWLKPAQWALVAGALFALSVVMRTAHLGGLIRHTEIRASESSSH